jgi:hypothetical protein
VSTNPARFVIVVALALVGILVISNGFDGTDLAAVSGSSPSASPSPEKDKKNKGGGQGDQQTDGQGTGGDTTGDGGTLDPKAAAEGVTIAVYNGTVEAGLAAQVELDLEKAIKANPAQDPSNVLGEEEATLLYYRDERDAEVADFIARRYLGGAEVAPLKDLDQSNLEADLSPDAQIVILVGNDYLQ